MRALTEKQVSELRESHRKATMGERGYECQVGDYIEDETEEKGIRQLTESEWINITDGLPKVADVGRMVILQVKQPIPDGSVFKLISPDGQEVPLGVMVAMEWRYYDLNLPTQEFLHRYVMPAVIPLREAFQKMRAAGVDNLNDLQKETAA